jgi:hypothetical protein
MLIFLIYANLKLSFLAIVVKRENILNCGVGIVKGVIILVIPKQYLLAAIVCMFFNISLFILKYNHILNMNKLMLKNMQTMAARRYCLGMTKMITPLTIPTPQFRMFSLLTTMARNDNFKLA